MDEPKLIFPMRDRVVLLGLDGSVFSISGSGPNDFTYEPLPVDESDEPTIVGD